MSILIQIAVISLWFAATAAFNDNYYFSDKFVRFLNKKQTSWTAARNFPKRMPPGSLNALLNGSLPMKKLPKQKKRLIPNRNMHIPRSFDPRNRWPHCAGVLSDAREQGLCGSCWAVSSAYVMTARHCIWTGGYRTHKYSAEDILTCCTYCGQNCNGSSPDFAFRFWKYEGIVSGGEYKSLYGCKPYSNSTMHGTVPPCVQKCTNELHKLSYNKDKLKGDPDYGYYGVKGGIEDIQRELMTHGPIVVGIRGYEDFLCYKSGIYSPTAKENSTKGHAISLIGWGESDYGVPYWLVMNSWGRDWGLNGVCKMLRGYNVAGIESHLRVTGAPKMKDRSRAMKKSGSSRVEC